MPYNFCADGIHIQKLCSRLSSREVQFCVFEPLWVGRGLGTTYDVHLKLTGKLCVMAEVLRVNID